MKNGIYDRYSPAASGAITHFACFASLRFVEPVFLPNTHR